MEEKFICRQCKEEKKEDPRTLLKEEGYGGFVLFTPLCEGCLEELKSKSLDELFPIKKD